METMFLKRPTRGKVLLQMPAEIRYSAVPSDWEITKSVKGDVVTLQWWSSGASDTLLAADPAAIKRNFFNVKSPEQAETFLRESGPFRMDSIGVTWPMFQAWQDYFRRQIKMAKGWGSPPERAETDALHRVMGEPHLRIASLPVANGRRQNTLILECRSVVETIAAVIFMDKRTGVKNEICLECGKPFERTRSTAKYCSPKCVHRNWRQKKQANSEAANAKG